MGVVWRATYTKTGQRVAIKIMLPGLSDDNSNAAARFEREAEILKQFNHPNIVRLFGIGKFQGTRYYAMEFIEGESLDRIMSRRDRMTWEEVVSLGKQLCAALQHAPTRPALHPPRDPQAIQSDDSQGRHSQADRLRHRQGHGRYPADRGELHRRHGVVHVARADVVVSRNLSAKSDLYSLGIVFYELLTGRKPFEAENAMEIFMQHVNGKMVRPGKRVLDLPIWFDNLVVQLMEKKPEQRPVDAAMVASVLETIAEKGCQKRAECRRRRRHAQARRPTPTRAAAHRGGPRDRAHADRQG